MAVAASSDDEDSVQLVCDSDFCPAHVTQESDFDFKKIEGGCYKNTIDDFQKTGYTNLDTYTHRYSRGTKTSSEDCINSCKTGKTSARFMNYHYAALEAGGSCFCGSAEPQEELDLSECPMTCSGDDTDYCGGADNHATIYNVENTISKFFEYSIVISKLIDLIKDRTVSTTRKKVSISNTMIQP